uniref:Putative LAGLIDADG endonuclease n=1 Tax=Cyberlindnera suaveolens TaxID=907738 RepID=S5TG43_9ASCO|nr:putative LAGLIDADG endonuclease [Cyberlindnera suaveolens]AGS44422.1 putative LAGLIDADG endonuclease [Cyberlindnera suaveolens]
MKKLNDLSNTNNKVLFRLESPKSPFSKEINNYLEALLLNTNYNSIYTNEFIFNEYICGYIDGDGSFYISVKYDEKLRKLKENIDNKYLSENELYKLWENLEYKNNLNLYIGKTRQISPRFGVHCHILDEDLLIKIFNQLSISENNIRKSYRRNSNNKIISVFYYVENINLLMEKILPFFDKYQLLTNKYYSYKKFKLSLLQYLETNNKDKFALSSMYINNYVPISNLIITKKNLNLYYILGLFEAEGNVSWSLTKNNLTWSISQNNLSEFMMESVKNYLNNLDMDPNTPDEIKINLTKKNWVNIYKKKNNMLELAISDLNFLHYKLFYNIDKHNFWLIGHKRISFTLFRIISTLYIRGIHTHPEVKKWINFIFNNIMNKQLTLTEVLDIINLEEIHNFLNYDLVYNEFKSYRTNSQKGGIFVYDKNKVFIVFIPSIKKTEIYFLKLGYIHGAKRTSINNYAMNNKLFLNNYYLYKSPIHDWKGENIIS